MCNFFVPFTGNVTALIKMAKDAISQAGGSFNEVTPTSGNFSASTSLGHITGSYTGDASSGSCTVAAAVSHIAGTYKTDGTMLTVDITHLPLLVSCNTLKEKLTQVLSNAS